MNARRRSSLELLSIVLALACGCAVEYTVPLESSPQMCEPGLLACAGGCVDPSLDSDHCGGCDRPCASDEVCMQRECMAECPGGQMMCDQFCIDVADDLAHCGGCNRPCDAEEVCTDGVCVEECDESCDDDVQLCVEGECKCRDGFVLCDGECADLSTDEDHCGMCDRDCGEQFCGGGECQPDDCPGFPDICEYSCTDVQSDPLNCGDCGFECHASQDCVGGRCVPGGSG